MRVIPPLEITDARLTSSSATEPHAPAAYNAGTTYAAHAIISVAADFKIYESLVGGNIGHTPSTSPTWWRVLGPTETAYNPATTYAMGDTVSSATTHHIYESLAAGNIGNPLPVPPETETTKWLDVGPTNKRAMFDAMRNTRTVYPSPLTVVLTPGTVINSLSGIDVDATSFIATMVAGASTVYTHSENLVTRDVNDWWDFFFASFKNKPNFVLFDLPAYYNGVITVVFTNTGGNVAIGALAIGLNEYVGAALYQAESDALNFSTITRSPIDGSAVLFPRPNVPKLNVRTVINKTYATRMMNLRERLTAVPAIWFGVEDDDDDWFALMTMLGFSRRFLINVDQPEKAVLTLELEGF